MLFLIFKSLHIIAIVAWMAGLMLYPRYKIHQLGDVSGGILFERMKDASDKLKVNPAIIGAGGPLWFPLKLALVFVITGFHGWFTSQGKKIDAGSPAADQVRLRRLNEIPFIALIIIVFLVVLKPF